MTTPKEAHPWRHEIQHGPEGEANYAWVYDADGEMVCTAKTHHAEAIVARMNSTASLQGEDAVERVARELERHDTAVYEWTPQQFDTWWTKDPHAENNRKRQRSRARAILATGLVPDEAAIRASAFEEAAKIAEATEVRSNGHPQIDAPTPGDMRRAIAAAIRSGGGE